MRTVGITGANLKWVWNWLRDRTQREVVGGTLSEQGIVGSGVPQGLVLGPLLFLFYINLIYLTEVLQVLSLNLQMTQN